MADTGGKPREKLPILPEGFSIAAEVEAYERGGPKSEDLEGFAAALELYARVEDELYGGHGAESLADTLAALLRDAEKLSYAPTHPLVLAMCLEFGNALYAAGETSQASEVLKRSFDNAIAELDKLEEDMYKQSTLVMQVQRDNLTLWLSPEVHEEAKAVALQEYLSAQSQLVRAKIDLLSPKTKSANFR